MLNETKTTKELEAFCASKGIKLREGKIRVEDKDIIEKYLKKVFERERQHTRYVEEEANWKPNFLSCIVKDEMLFSPIEDYLWKALEREELTKKATTQHPIGPYKIDIAYPDIKLAVECDGHEYHKDDKAQIERDQRRDKYLARKGWKTLRFSGLTIRRGIASCVDKIRFYVEQG